LGTITGQVVTDQPDFWKFVRGREQLIQGHLRLFRFMQGKRALNPGFRPFGAQFDDGAGDVHTHVPLLGSGVNL
jgi:hypothetical protein